jgi:two-component system OmpR family sensor kinase
MPRTAYLRHRAIMRSLYEQGRVLPPADDDARDGESLEQLQRRNAELTEAVAARDAFLAVAAHDLRNPMTPVVGHIQRLRRLMRSRSVSWDEVEQSLARIEWLMDLYVKRATTLLDVSRITSGKLRLEIAAVNLSEVMRNVVAGLQPAAQYSGSGLELAVEDDLIVTADRLALEQILDNLLLNAIKYGAGKPIDVAVRRDAVFIAIEIRDQGIGMSKDDQQRIFEPFERAVARGSAAGFGVGLWVVRQLVDALGGEITVVSEAGNGSIFTVRLPTGAGEAHE